MWTGFIDMRISPKQGIPFETEFTIEATKHMVSSPVLCEFGYFHPRGKIVLLSQKGEFNDNTITKKFKLLPVS